MNYREIAESCFKIFCAKEGNQYIASENALHGILKFANRKKCENILELGIGIGTIPFTLDYAKKINAFPALKKYVGTEANEYCISEFKKNLDPNTAYDFTHLKTLDELSADYQFHFVIVDGQETNLEKVVKQIRPNGLVFFEGDRKPQRDRIIESIKNENRDFVVVYAISNRKNRSYGPFPAANYMGGYTIFILEPRLIDRLTAKYERLKVAVKYRLRKIGL